MVLKKEGGREEEKLWAFILKRRYQKRGEGLGEDFFFRSEFTFGPWCSQKTAQKLRKKENCPYVVFPHPRSIINCGIYNCMAYSV